MPLVANQAGPLFKVDDSQADRTCQRPGQLQDATRRGFPGAGTEFLPQAATSCLRPQPEWPGPGKFHKL